MSPRSKKVGRLRRRSYDIRTEFPNGSQPPYVPVNYDGKEHGLVTVRTALANSLQRARGQDVRTLSAWGK